MTFYDNPAPLLYRIATHPLCCLERQPGEKHLLLISVGNGMADDPGFNTNVNIAANLAGLPSKQKRGIQIEQDIDCRLVAGCSYGTFIDSELRDLTCCEAGTCANDGREAEHIPLDRDLGRAFLYARYNANLSADGPTALGCSKMEPEKVQKVDAVEQIDNLVQIGLSASNESSNTWVRWWKG